MDISLVLAVFNKLDLTKDCYKRIREIYPDAPFVISSGGSTDGTKEWLESLEDDNLSYIHDDDKLVFSENYNAAIKLVDTEKLVLIHNDMVIGRHFLENLDRLLTPDTLLSYTTLEPPIFKGHNRPGKLIVDMGYGFHDFKWEEFDEFVEENKSDCKIYDGAVFFMSGYKKMFEKLKGYKLKTTTCAITYHFVSQTSRFSEEFKKDRMKYEINSNRNFVRKWGIPIPAFNELRYWEDDGFRYKTFTMGLTTRSRARLFEVEPFFDKIDLGMIPEDYLENEQKNTRYDLRSKFVLTDLVDVMVYEMSPMTDEDIYVLQKLRLSIPYYEPGEYKVGSLKIEIKKGV